VFLLFITFSLFADNSDELRITSLGDTSLEAAISEEEQSDRSENLYEIYDVYEDVLIVGDSKTYVRLVDSVYLVQVKQDVLVFHYIWEGEKKYLKKDYYLVPTGHVYKAEVQEIKKITQKTTASLFPVDIVQLFHFTGGGVVVQSNMEDEETDVSGIIQTELLLLIGNVFTTAVRAHTNETLSIARMDLELGVWGPVFRLDFMKYNFSGGFILPLVDDDFVPITGNLDFGLFYVQFGFVFIIPLAEQGFFKSIYLGIDFRFYISVSEDDSSLINIAMPLKVGYRIF
jgi:hypothetical protein